MNLTKLAFQKGFAEACQMEKSAASGMLGKMTDMASEMAPNWLKNTSDDIGDVGKVTSPDIADTAGTTGKATGPNMPSAGGSQTRSTVPNPTPGGSNRIGTDAMGKPKSTSEWEPDSVPLYAGKGSVGATATSNRSVTRLPNIGGTQVSDQAVRNAPSSESVLNINELSGTQLNSSTALDNAVSSEAPKGLLARAAENPFAAAGTTTLAGGGLLGGGYAVDGYLSGEDAQNGNSKPQGLTRKQILQMRRQQSGS